MRVTVRFFAAHREATGHKAFATEVPDGARASEVLALIKAQFPSLSSTVSSIAFAINRQQVPADSVLRDGDELALLPPMAGG